MKGRLCFGVLSGVLVASLALVACGPAASFTEAAPTAVRVTPTLAPSVTPAPVGTSAAVPTPSAVPTVDAGALVRWTFATEGPIWGLPALIDDVIYVGSDDGALYAVGAASGDLLWTFSTGGFVRSQPAVVEGRVYIASDDGYVYAVDAAAGTQVWRTDVGNAEPAEQRTFLGGSDPEDYDYRQSSPVVVDGRLFVGSFDGQVYALATGTGEIVWTYQTGEKVRATPVVADGTVYVGSWDTHTYALDAATGDLKWEAALEGQIQSTALVADGLVFTASRRAAVFALDAATGERVWTYPYGSNMWVESSAVLVGDTIYIGSSGSKVIYGLDAKTGRTRLIDATGMFCWATPVMVDETLVIGCAQAAGNPEGLYAFTIVPGDARPGVLELVELWHLPMTETLEATDTWYGAASGPVVDARGIYFGGLDGVLYALNR